MSNLARMVRSKVFSGQLPKVILYVIGEIFFVVIGILVAFQVSSWNEERKTRQEEVVLLKALSREMKDNANQLKDVIAHNDRSRQAALMLTEIYQQDYNELKTQTLDSLFAQVQWAWTFNPKVSVLSSIKVNGKINAIQNPAIQEFIASFEEEANDSEEESLVIRSLIVDKYVLAVSKYLSVKARAKYLGFNITKSKFNSDYKGVFKDREIESLLYYIYIWRENEAKEMNGLLQQLLNEIEVVDKEITK